MELFIENVKPKLTIPLSLHCMPLALFGEDSQIISL